jgi:periplasmic copper chaperone A
MMKKILLFTALLLSFTGKIYAHQYQAGNLTVDHPYAYEVKKGDKETTVFMTITNNGKAHDHLLSATSPIAEDITLLDGNINLEELEITEHQSVKFSPEHIHLKLTGIKLPIAAGTRKPISLFFETQGEVKAELLFVTADETGLDKTAQ